MKEEKSAKSKETIMKVFVLVFIATLIIIAIARYITDEDFRYNIDTNLLKKEISEENLNTIEIDSDTNPSIFAYDKYIAVLSKNKFSEYTSDGKIAAELDVNISVPLVATNDKYMVLAEKDGQRIYLISGSNILWQNDLEGSISRVNVNKNGYVSVIIKTTIYKSVVVFFNNNGVEIFRSYSSSNYAVCTSVSTNNKYLAIGEVDYSGTIVKSYVKIFSVELTQTDPDNSIIYTYESENGEIITNINYQSKDAAICMFNSYVQKVSLDSNERLYDIIADDIFVDTNLSEGFVVVDKQSSGFFSYEYELTIKSTTNKTENLYILNSDLPKTINVSGNIMALNLGNEVQIINSNGWLLKKYISGKQISNVVVGDTIVGIVYKNKIEIINL